MHTFDTIMAILTISAAAIIIPRMMIDWQRCREFIREDDEESLRKFVAEQKRWIARHGISAMGAIGVVAIITCTAGMASFEKLAGVTTAYGMMTLTFAFIESLMAFRAENRLQARTVSAKEVREFGN